MKYSDFKKRYILLVVVIAFIVIGYWLKSQMGVDFFDSLSISNYFPFKYLTSNILRSPEPGIIFEENFNTNSLFKKWSDLWMRDEGSVTIRLSSNGPNNSRCLLIESTSKGTWTYSHNKLVEVKKKDIFYYEGVVGITGDDLSAYLSVAAFDENKKVIDWNLFKEKVTRTNAWVGVERHFTIDDDNIRYITFRLTGMGRGQYRFDDIIFRKIK